MEKFITAKASATMRARGAPSPGVGVGVGLLLLLAGAPGGARAQAERGLPPTVGSFLYGGWRAADAVVSGVALLVDAGAGVGNGTLVAVNRTDLDLEPARNLTSLVDFDVGDVSVEPLHLDRGLDADDEPLSPPEPERQRTVPLGWPGADLSRTEAKALGAEVRALAFDRVVADLAGVPSSARAASAAGPIPGGAALRQAGGGCAGGTVLEGVEANARLATVAAALRQSGLDATLSGPGPQTFFAPTDAAFAQLATELEAGGPDAAAVLRLGLEELLLYHLASGVVNPRESGRTIATLGGQDLFLGDLRVERVEDLCNGRLVVVSEVLVPRAADGGGGGDAGEVPGLDDSQPVPVEDEFEEPGGDGLFDGAPAARPACGLDACCDKTPPGPYTCAEQAGWGKCSEPWMARGNFCRLSCGECFLGPGDDGDDGDDNGEGRGDAGGYRAQGACAAAGVLYQSWSAMPVDQAWPMSLPQRDAPDRVEILGGASPVATPKNLRKQGRQRARDVDASGRDTYRLPADRVCGHFCPPVDGRYRFFTNADEQAKLYLADPDRRRSRVEAQAKRSDCKVTLYEDADFSGRSRTFRVGAYGNLKDFDINDRTSAVRVEGAGCVAYLSRHAWFEGESCRLPEPGYYGRAQLEQRGCRNDRASSLQVVLEDAPPLVYQRQRSDGWNRHPQQQASPFVELERGRPYKLEAERFTARSSGGHFELGVELPNGRKLQPVPAAYFSEDCAASGAAVDYQEPSAEEACACTRDGFSGGVEVGRRGCFRYDIGEYLSSVAGRSTGSAIGRYLEDNYGAPPETQSMLGRLWSRAFGDWGRGRSRRYDAQVCYVKTPSACPLAEVSETYEGAAWRLCE